MPSPADIIRHHDVDPGLDPFVPGSTWHSGQIAVLPYDDAWPATFDDVAGRVRAALGERMLEIHHVGSTSVPGLAAKPVIDVDLVVGDSADEPAYIPDLVAAGFEHHIREPWWHEHRCLVLANPRANLHVFSPDCPEVTRHLLFRDWLHSHPADRERYARAKTDSASASNAAGERMVDYNLRKQPAIRAIYDDIFRANGWLAG